MSSSNLTSGVFARPYSHDSVGKFQTILNSCTEHRPWYDDRLWNSGETARRVVASQYLADAYTGGALWEVWSASSHVALVGVGLFNHVSYGRDAQCHFVFFDRRLADKVTLCKAAMADAFQRFDLEALRLEVPTYAHALALWARKKLGFRYEAERRTFSWPQDAIALDEKQAMLGSRKHHATMYEGVWHDALMLSITSSEFHSQ